jgi:predicted membrane protein
MRSTRVLVGLALVALGTLFILDRTGALDAGAVLRDWWPVAIIALGALQLFDRQGSAVGPLIIIGVGVVLFLNRLDVLEASVWPILWPVALIVVGVAILVRRPRARPPEGTGDDVVRASAVFGGQEVSVLSRRFRGGAANAVFGGVSIDLRRAEMEHDGAVMSVTALFGGIDIIVPESWRVRLTGLPLFGGFDDERKAAPAADGPVLRIDATAIFGGVSVKSRG